LLFRSLVPALIDRAGFGLGAENADHNSSQSMLARWLRIHLSGPRVRGRWPITLDEESRGSKSVINTRPVRIGTLGERR
jgi:hypothetical protein